LTFQNLNLTEEAHQASLAPSDSAVRPVRVLVLDDDENLLSTLKRMGRAAGARVHTRSSWHGFEKALEEFDPDILLVDLMMPDKDGIDVLELVSTKNDLLCYIITGADTRTLEASLEVLSSTGAKVAGSLRKPFSLSSFRDLLEAPQLKRVPAEAEREIAPKRNILTPDQFKKAVRDRKVDPFFQPIFYADGRGLKGFEALARVRDEGSSFFAPEYLNQLVHDGPLSMLLTESIISKALAFLASLKAHPELSLSINIFGFHATSDGFREGLVHQCASYGIAHERVILELSESTVFRLTTDDLRKITKLRLAGFGLSIDDLGTGDSSLGRLANLPFSEMKIDKSFCMTILQSDTARAVVEACLGLAQRLKMEVTAEGIENEEIARLLRSMGCNALQGHYFGQALHRDRVKAWIDAGCPRHAE